MQMIKFIYNKLVRDKIPSNHEKIGSVVHVKPLNDTEFDAALRTKLQEEAEEVIASQSKQELIEELADLFDVIEPLMVLNGISSDDIRILQEKKRASRGGFTNRTFVTIAEHPADSEIAAYCRARPEKYKEI